MLPVSLNLTEELAATLRQLRLNHLIDGEVLTAENLSKAIGNNRAWMSQIESRRLKKVRREDIIKMYKYLFNEDDFLAEERAELDLQDFIDSKIPLTELQRTAIKNKRKQLGIRTDDLSKEIGRGAAYISQLENGKIINISLNTLKLIEEKLNCDIEDMAKEANNLLNPINFNNDINDIISENIILKQENEMLKKKLQSIMEIINM